MASASADSRTMRLLARVELTLPRPLPTLKRPTAAESKCSVSADHAEARRLLVEQRITKPDYKPPETGLRNRFSVRRRKEQANPDNWTFSDQEIGSLFETLLSGVWIDSPGVAEAVLNITEANLDEIWFQSRTTHGITRNSGVLKKKPPPRPALSELPWLSKVTMLHAVQHVRIMCQSGVGQAALDKAFAAALSTNSVATMEVLLSYGANPNSSINTIRGLLRQGHLRLARLLLSSPNRMLTEAWQYCLEPREPHPSITAEMLSLCLAHRPEVASEQMLQNALRLQDLTVSTVLLAYVDPSDVAQFDHESACKAVCAISDTALKRGFFELLTECNCIEDCVALQAELLKSVKRRDFALIKVLVASGVSLDREPNNALIWAMNNIHLDVLESMKDGKLSSRSSAANAVDLVPLVMSEAAFVRVIGTLAHLSPIPLPTSTLNSRLARACEYQQAKSVDLLLSLGAQPGSNDALAIQVAMQHPCLDILNTLLQRSCPPEVLSKIIPTALRLASRAHRLRVFQLVLANGVVIKELGTSLEQVIAEDGAADHELITLLIRHGASPDCSHWARANSVLVATRKADLWTAQMLCDAKPRMETLARAVPLAYERVESIGPDKTLSMLRLFLSRGASGAPVDHTLWTAVHRDTWLDAVKLLVAHGADANSRDGGCFLRAVQLKNHPLLQILCEGCRPSPESAKRALTAAIDPQHYDRKILDLLMQSLDVEELRSVSNTVWLQAAVAQQLLRHPNPSHVLASFLKQGVCVDANDGEVLVVAVQMKDPLLVSQVLSYNPNSPTLEFGFNATLGIQHNRLRITFMHLLLDHAMGSEIGQSRALVEQTQLAIGGGSEGLAMLLRNHASVDFDGGEALYQAATAGSSRLLRMLLHGKPTLFSLKRACLGVAASDKLSQAQKDELCECLLAASNGLLRENSTQLLHESVLKLPDNIYLPTLLLQQGVEVDSSTLEVGLVKASPDVLSLLLCHCDCGVAFSYSRRIDLSAARRTTIFQSLLTRPDHQISKCELSDALIEFLSKENMDLTIPKLLLKNGADVGCKNAQPFQQAIRSGSVATVKLLSQHIKRASVGDAALAHLIKTNIASPTARMHMMRCILERNVSKLACSKALVSRMDKNELNLDIIRLLLQKGARPTRDMFIRSCKSNDLPLFRVLCQQPADPDMVLNVIMKYCGSEANAVLHFYAWHECSSHKERFTDDTLLFPCLRRFRQGKTLLDCLLSIDLPAPAMIPFCLRDEKEPELCTVVIWALLVRPRIATETIKVLLKHNAIRAQLEYTTPKTRVSAAFACLLDTTRLPILAALLAADSTALTDYKVPGTTLAGFANCSNDETDGAIDVGPKPLYKAAFWLGNFEAFSLLTKTNPHPSLASEEGLLHVAALLALPKFIPALLCSNDANARLEDWDYYIPLAVALVTTTPNRLCRVANEEEDFQTRRKRTIELLAPVTDLSWTDRRKTVLHFALHQGPQTTRTLLRALKLSGKNKASNIDGKFLYTDKDDKVYKPGEYVRAFMKDGEEGVDQKGLLACLKEAGFEVGE